MAAKYQEAVISPSRGKDISTQRVWRYLALLDPSTEVVMFRDSDAIMLQKDVNAATQWLHSARLYHVMRDHYYHGVPILAGMFGVKLGQQRKEIRKYASELIYRSIGDQNKNTDQKLLAEIFWNHVSKNSTVHDAYFCESFKVCQREIRPFPTKRKSLTFVGNTQNNRVNKACPVECRPKNHKDWLFC
ncbi:uncharacterized protein LOC136024688 [Artemia franciscana]|uniref:uncharacterized protein LOC136024688 n=1 Tax=Artemia franciscana TaxID=6661 RepID=UPI0032DBCF19